MSQGAQEILPQFVEIFILFTIKVIPNFVIIYIANKFFFKFPALTQTQTSKTRKELGDA